MNIGNFPRPGWLPDWQDEAQYEDHGDYLQDWAWEFLRRNPEYQKDYARWAELPDEDEAGKNHSPKYAVSVCLEDDMRYYHAVPAALPGETVAQFETRTSATAVLLQLHLWPP